MKGTTVPEEARSAIYNLYRLPLNIIVVGTLALKLELTTAFIVTTVLLLIAVYFQTRLIGYRRQAGGAGPYARVGTDDVFGSDDELSLGEGTTPVSVRQSELASMIGNKL